MLHRDIKQLAKFGVVGIVNTIIGTVVMFGLYNICGASYWLSSAANYIVGSIFSYFMNKIFTFEVKKRDYRFVVKFIINITICYLLAYSVAKRLVIYCLAKNGIDNNVVDNISMLVGMVLFVILNFVGQKFFVFNEKVTWRNKQ